MLCVRQRVAITFCARGWYHHLSTSYRGNRCVLRPSPSEPAPERSEWITACSRLTEAQGQARGGGSQTLRTAQGSAPNAVWYWCWTLGLGGETRWVMYLPRLVCELWLAVVGDLTGVSNCTMSNARSSTTEKANPAKAGGAKPRVLAPSATPLRRHEGTHDRRATEGLLGVCLVRGWRHETTLLDASRIVGCS